MSQLGSELSVHVVVEAFETMVNPDYNLLRQEVLQALTSRLRRGELQGVLVTPPLATWGQILRGAQGEVIPLRTPRHPSGLPRITRGSLRSALWVACLRLLHKRLHRLAPYPERIPEPVQLSDRGGRLVTGHGIA